jgi:hypothetical protein
MRSSVFILALCTAVACCGCSAGPAPAAAARPDPNATLAQIRALVGTSGCTQDSQCHSLALGARACGGPESYLPWSSAQTPADALRALGERYKAEREAANRAGGMVSDCRFQPDPGAVCRAGTCQPGAQAPLPN